MPHPYQKGRKQAMDAILSVLEATMNNEPPGARDGYFQAILQRKFGFSDRSLNKYIKIMLKAGEIMFNEETEIWTVCKKKVKKEDMQKT